MGEGGPRRVHASIGEDPFPEGMHYLSGNEAAAEGASRGLPILWRLSNHAFQRTDGEDGRSSQRIGGYFYSNEDEIASISAVIGASWAGGRR